jgi:hypothetical protein
MREVAERAPLSASNGAAPYIHDVDGNLPGRLQLTGFSYDDNATPVLSSIARRRSVIGLSTTRHN